MINGPGKYSVKIATPRVTIGADGAPQVRCMKALAQQISELDSVVIYGRVVGVRGLVMERAIAERGRYPAVNVLKPVSRTMPRAADQAYLPELTRARQVMATYADMEEFIRLGAYRAGTGPEVDEAIRLHKPLEAFLAQVRKKQPAWRKDTVGWPKSWPPRKPNANVIAP
jgi:flagellar biosynthesis/type III secretory pathway ATPase